MNYRDLLESGANVSVTVKLDDLKYAIYDAVKAALPECRSWGDLEKRLSRDGIAVTFKYSGGTATKQGVIFGKDGLSFNGSKIDRAFSFLKLDAALNANAQHREIRNVSPPTPERVTTPMFSQLPQLDHGHRAEPQHSHSHSGGSFLDGVFDMELGPGPGEKDDTGQKPKKKKKRQYKQSW